MIWRTYLTCFNWESISLSAVILEIRGVLSTNMLSMEDIIFMIVITGEFIIGMLGNACIGLVNSIDWIKKKKISSIDYILTSLAKIGLLCIMILNGTKIVFCPDFYKKDKLQAVINIFWILTNYLSMWFTTCLNVFYLLKIANFSHPPFSLAKEENWQSDSLDSAGLFGSFFLNQPYTSNDTKLWLWVL